MLIILFVACKEEKPKILNIEDLRPKAKETKKEQNVSASSDTLTNYIKSYNKDSFLLEIKSLNPIEVKSFFNRFAPIKQEKFQLFTSDTMLELFHSTWTFKDSMSTTNAFYNWLDIEHSSKLGGNFSFGKQNYLMIISKNKIDLIESNQKIPFENWCYLLRNRNSETKNFRWIVLFQSKKKKVQWEFYEPFTLKPFQL
jgi:hypothetical protein